jgi:uncharacterized protein related to proFAR isomerase
LFRIETLPLSYYIYYRVAQPDRAQMLVRDIQAALKSRTGIAGRVLRKRDDPATWMEIYEGVGDAAAFEQDLATAVQAAIFAAVLESGGVRHMECFET